MHFILLPLIAATLGIETAADPTPPSPLNAHEQKEIAACSPQTAKKIERGDQLTLADIKTMNDAGITDDKIIATIKSTGSIYYLTAADIQNLKDAGVSPRVIKYMMQTGY